MHKKKNNGMSEYVSCRYLGTFIMKKKVTKGPYGRRRKIEERKRKEEKWLI